MLLYRAIYQIQHLCERNEFVATRSSGDEDNATLLRGKIGGDTQSSQILYLRGPERDEMHNT